ncbi:phosphatase PAP2 family protein [Truepera radiovictrix]|uniref:Phosphoesterase PA-phosphatase related protein n=1 Tax=Truepera radiovictrix (strain DSM 17093 / CIP 108686 / LMG 22925 / RQ-24) TaxID=649638 RepID=D7CUP3_TRURR|nr:phosphatase PAP2 family protein [Truepera radiovictrix]ADI14034.1 phosphoesterase PA-phosphatase related protein [Truepera radiovictrix DSM 17093]WMT57406.1 phosphatase PAP2 family protein [Truepera radiovictrix]
MDRTLWPRLSWRLLLYWAVLLGSVWAFAELTDEVYEQEGFFFDEPVLGWFYGLITPLRTRVALALSTVGGVEVMVGLTALITLLLWFRSRREAVFFAASMVGASAIMGLTKVLLARPRPELFPDVDLWQTGSSSFPSGHATGSAALALTLYLVVSRLAPRWRALAAVLGLAFALSVSASRLYLQVHYPSDVLAGLALGCAWVLGVNALYRYASRDRSRRSVRLTLPHEVVAAYRQDAAARGLSDDEVVGAVLAAHYALTRGEEAPHRAPSARVDVFKSP